MEHAYTTDQATAASGHLSMVSDPIPIARPTLERLLAILTKQYERQPSREVKQATNMLKKLLGHAA